MSSGDTKPVRSNNVNAADTAAVPGFFRISTCRVGLRTDELVQNLAAATVTKPQLSTALLVNQERYRARMKAESKSADLNAQFVTVPQARNGANDILMGPSERTMLCKWCFQPQRYCPGHMNMYIDLGMPQVDPEKMPKFRMLVTCICFHHCGLNFHVSPKLTQTVLAQPRKLRMKYLFEYVREMGCRYCHEDYDVLRETQRLAQRRRQEAVKLAANNGPPPTKRTKPTADTLATAVISSDKSGAGGTNKPEPEISGDGVDDSSSSSSSSSSDDDDENRIRQREEKADDAKMIDASDDDDDEDAKKDAVVSSDDDDQEENVGQGDEEDEKEDGGLEIEEEPAVEEMALDGDEPVEEGAVDMDMDAGEDGGAAEEGGGDAVGDGDGGEDGGEGGGGGDGDDDGEGRATRKRRVIKRKPATPRKRRGGGVSAGSGRKSKSAAAQETEMKRLESEVKARAEYHSEVEDYKNDTNHYWRASPHYKFSRLSKPLSPIHYETEGCGFPIPEVEFGGNSGLDPHFRYRLPWEGNVSKHVWPRLNNEIMYNVLRNLDAQGIRAVKEGRMPIHELFGMDPHYSPFRGLMTWFQPVLPTTARPSKNEGAKNTAPDDTLTMSLKQMSTNAVRMEEKLWEENSGFVDIVKLPNKSAPEVMVDLHDIPCPFRHVMWVKRGRPWDECRCKASRRCNCEASGITVLCQCEDPDICTCIVASLPETSIFRREADLKSKFTDKPVSYRQVVPLPPNTVRFKDVKRDFQRRYPKGTTIFVPKTKRQGKRWFHNQSVIGNELVGFISGDIKKRSEGRKSSRKGVATWAAGNAAQIKAGKQERCLARRQVKKTGRLRMLLSKRCNMTIRDVIIPKVYGGMDVMYFPLTAKRTLSFPHVVHRRNRGYCHDRIRNNEALRLKSSELIGQMHNMRYLNSGSIELRDGVTIDMVLDESCFATANRQPTLWGPSMQGASMRFIAAYVKLLGIANMPPYNADCDGDEMTSHVAQSQATRAENADIMMAKHQLRSQHGMSSTMGMIQNPCSAANQLGRRDALFVRQEFMANCGQFSYADDVLAVDSIARLDRFLIDGLPPPSIWGHLDDKPGNEDRDTLGSPDCVLVDTEPLWTGCQLISLFLPQGLCYTPHGIPTTLDAMRQKTVILNGNVVCGRLTKDELGPGSNTLPHVILNDYGPTVCKYWIYGNESIWNYYIERWPMSMSRHDYVTEEDAPLRAALIAAVNETLMKPEHQNYDMSLVNDTELFVLGVQKRAQELIITQHLSNLDERNRCPNKKPHESITHEGSAVTNHVLAQIGAKTKGTHVHLGQLGAIYGAPREARLPGQTAHYNVTSHLPENNGWITTSLSEGSLPIGYWVLLWLARYGMVTANRSVPENGYGLRRLIALLQGLHREHDHTNRDTYGHIHQFRAGDDDFNPAMCEYVPFIYMTPPEHASDELRRHQDALVHVMNTLHRCIDFRPKSLVLPIQLARAFQKVQLETPRTVHDKTVTEDHVKEWSRDWWSRMYHVFQIDVHGNLTLKTMYLDFLSPWHMCIHARATVRQFNTFLSVLEHATARAAYPQGQSVGTMTAQSTTEQATQTALHMGKHLGNKAPIAPVASDAKSKKSDSKSRTGDNEKSDPKQTDEQFIRFRDPAALMERFSKRAGLVPPPQSASRLNETINATKKGELASMMITLHPPYNASYENAWLISQILLGRMWIHLVNRTHMYDPVPGKFAETIAQWPDDWARRQIQIYPDAPVSVTSFPTVRYELSRTMMYVLGLSLNLDLVQALLFSYRRGLFVMHSEMDETPAQAARTFETKGESEPVVLYLNFNLAAHPPLAKRVHSYQENQPKFSPAPYKIIIDSVLERALDTWLPRCIPQIKTVQVRELRSYTYHPHNHKEMSKTTSEWAIQTQGSHLPGLPYYHKVIRFCDTDTTFVHDVNRIYGIEGARECQVRALKLVSPLDSRSLGIIADTQTALPEDGKVTCATRNSMADRDPSLMKIAAFEEALKQILNSAVHSKGHDNLLSISASTQVGNSLSTGTGSVTVLPTTTTATTATTTDSRMVDSTSTIIKRAKQGDVMFLSAAASMTKSDNDVIMAPVRDSKSETEIKLDHDGDIKMDLEKQLEHEASFPQRQRLSEPRDWGFYQLFSVDGPQCVGGMLSSASDVDDSWIDQATEPVIPTSDDGLQFSHPDRLFFPVTTHQNAPSVPVHSAPPVSVFRPTRLMDGWAILEPWESKSASSESSPIGSLGYMAWIESVSGL